jgi:polyisoprenoid-binding protein YceI
LLVTAASGSVGTAAVQVAAAIGANVVAVAGVDSHERLLGMGASAAFDYREPDWTERLRQALPDSVDVLFDGAGGETRDHALDAVKRNGRAVFIVGAPRHVRPDIELHEVSADPTRHRLEAINRLVAEGRLAADVGVELPFERAREALEHTAARRRRGRAVVAIGPSTVVRTFPSGVWAVDPYHSSAEFSVLSMGLITVTGFLREFEGTLVVSPDGKWEARGSANAASIDTRAIQRDQQLRGEAFFSASAHPRIEFNASDISDLADDGRFRLAGELTIRGVTRTVTFAGEATGPGDDPWGGRRIGIRLSGEINRRDFGIDYAERAPSGAPVVSDDVQLELNLGLVSRVPLAIPIALRTSRSVQRRLASRQPTSTRSLDA